MAEAPIQLRMLVQPQSSYRGRYFSEVDPTRNRAQRFIRTDSNEYNLDYPTITFTTQSTNKSFYIGVTLVTVVNEQVPITYIHPYPIDTPEIGALKDTERNTLYFPISDEEFAKGEKSFRIARKKLAQYDLKNYGRFRPFYPNQKEIQCIDDPTNIRKLIEIYQLQQSQLIFSLAELVYDKQYPVIYTVTSIYSNIMTAMSAKQTNNNNNDSSIKYAPIKGSPDGNDEILMFIPKIDKRKVYRIIFDHPAMINHADIQITFVDTKTILFKTPRYPLPLNDSEQVVIPIVIMHNNEEIARVNFVYVACDRCSNWTIDLMYDSSDESNSHEQNNQMETYFDDSDMFSYTTATSTND